MLQNGYSCDICIRFVAFMHSFNFSVKIDYFELLLVVETPKLLFD